MCPPSTLLTNQTLAAVVCSTSNDVCTAICANTDLAGIGVRVAFYAQSAINTLLVVFSPKDSVQSAWAGTLLTAALIIAAIVQKIQYTLTLHHATLIMNFATLSCISSLAVAPMLPVWRLKPNSYYAKEFERRTHADPHAFNVGDHPNENLLHSEVYMNVQKKKMKVAQNRERIILALALLIQVVLQWAWGIILFVSPAYSQSECSGDTVLMLFFFPFTVRNITGAKFAVWPLWLLFSLSVTLALTVILSLSSPNRAHDLGSRRSTVSVVSASSSSTPIVEQLARLLFSAIPSWKDRTKFLISLGHAAAFLLWSLYIFASEYQRSKNCIFFGENNFGGFGQITAILLSLQPVWSLVVALYRYPSLKRRQERHRKSTASRSHSPGPSGSSPETRGLLTISPQHSPTNSQDLSRVIVTAPEEIEMVQVGSQNHRNGNSHHGQSAHHEGAISPTSPSNYPTSRRHSRRGLHEVAIPTSDIGISNMDWLT